MQLFFFFVHKATCHKKPEIFSLRCTCSKKKHEIYVFQCVTKKIMVRIHRMEKVSKKQIVGPPWNTCGFSPERQNKFCTIAWTPPLQWKKLHLQTANFPSYCLYNFFGEYFLVFRSRVAELKCFLKKTYIPRSINSFLNNQIAEKIEFVGEEKISTQNCNTFR